MTRDGGGVDCVLCLRGNSLTPTMRIMFKCSSVHGIIKPNCALRCESNSVNFIKPLNSLT